jgi:transcriptional regulator with XRE-family HTH domain
MSRAKNDTPVRLLRIRIGTQRELAALLGCAVSTEQGYERQAALPLDLAERMALIATERGLPDLAMLLLRMGSESPTVLAPYPALKHGNWHEILDAVLDSGDDQAIRSVQEVLRLAGRGGAAPTLEKARQTGPKA